MLPELVIGGAPKCGTSSLYRWLCAHPDACGSRPKEVFYFMDREHPLRRPEANYLDHGLEKYGNHFAHCSGGVAVRFEATTHYLYQETARRVFARRKPTPQVAFVLREPSARVWSSFRFTKNNLANLNRDVSFRQYVNVSLHGSRRELEILLEGSPSAYVLARDVRYSQYVDYLLAWREHIEADHLHVFLFEDMVADPRSFMKKLARILDLDPRFYDAYDYDTQNRTRNIRNQPIHRLARKWSTYLRESPLKALLKKTYLFFQGKARAASKTADVEKALAELEQHFQPYNQRLSREFDLDLSEWE